MIETSSVCAHCLFMQMTLTKKKKMPQSHLNLNASLLCLALQLYVCGVCVCCFYCFFFVLSFRCFPKHTLPLLKSTKQMGPVPMQSKPTAGAESERWGADKQDKSGETLIYIHIRLEKKKRSSRRRRRRRRHGRIRLSFSFPEFHRSIMPHIKKKKYYDNYVCLIEIFWDRCSYFDRAQKKPSAIDDGKKKITKKKGKTQKREEKNNKQRPGETQRMAN